MQMKHAPLRLRGSVMIICEQPRYLRPEEGCLFRPVPSGRVDHIRCKHAACDTDNVAVRQNSVHVPTHNRHPAVPTMHFDPKPHS